jgi:predicted GNAT family acetyltransferase
LGAIKASDGTVLSAEMSESRDVRIQDNPRELRYELRVGGELVGQIRYRRKPGSVVLVHTEIDPEIEGQGLGAALVRGALEDIRSRGELVVPFCPFVAAYIRRHPEYKDLVTVEH